MTTNHQHAPADPRPAAAPISRSCGARDCAAPHYHAALCRDEDHARSARRGAAAPGSSAAAPAEQGAAALDRDELTASCAAGPRGRDAPDGGCLMGLRERTATRPRQRARVWRGKARPPGGCCGPAGDGGGSQQVRRPAAASRRRSGAAALARPGRRSTCDALVFHARPGQPWVFLRWRLRGDRCAAWLGKPRVRGDAEGRGSGGGAESSQGTGAGGQISRT